MRRSLYIYIVVLVVLFTSCNNYEETTLRISREDMSEVEQVTIMYFLGTNLWYFFDYYSLPGVRNAVADGALGSGGRLFVFKSSTSSSAELYEIYEDGGEYVTHSVKSYSDSTTKLSATPERMAEVIGDVQLFASSKRYNLIMSGHGTGWVLQSHPYLKSIDSSYVDWEQMGSGDVVTRFMGCSEDGFMEISEMREALESTNTKYGYILFDMCLMSNIETLYELRDVCDNVIASPAEIMGAGFPYEEVLPELFDDNGASTDYEGACKAYYNWYNTTSSTYNSATISWCVTSELEGLAGSVKAINEAGVKDVDIDDLQYYEKLTTHVFCDLMHYVREASAELQGSLYETFEQSLDGAFPIEGRYHTSRFYSGLGSYGWVTVTDSNYSGVSTSEPSTKFTDEWAQTSWAQATQLTMAD